MNIFDRIRARSTVSPGAPIRDVLSAQPPDSAVRSEDHVNGDAGDVMMSGANHGPFFTPESLVDETEGLIRDRESQLESFAFSPESNITSTEPVLDNGERAKLPQAVSETVLNSGRTSQSWEQRRAALNQALGLKPLTVRDAYSDILIGSRRPKKPNTGSAVTTEDLEAVTGSASRVNSFPGTAPFVAPGPRASGTFGQQAVASSRPGEVLANYQRRRNDELQRIRRHRRSSAVVLSEPERQRAYSG